MKRRTPSLPPVGYDGRFELGVKEVDDPFELDKTVVVAVNIRRDVIELLFNQIDPTTGKRRINEAQKRAGNYFLGLLERAEEARGLALDYARDRVDGGQGVEEFPLDRERAVRELARLKVKIGDYDYALARRVVGSGTALSSLASGPADRRYLSRRFRDALTQMAIYWGYAKE